MSQSAPAPEGKDREAETPGEASRVDRNERSLLGVILAGGASRRFGQEKALYSLAGRPMARWVVDALLPWTQDQVVIANDPRIPEALDLPGRADEEPGLGPAGGLITALKWSREEGHDGIFLVACDLPLVSSELVGRILAAWPWDSPAVVPWSPGPLGLEPLCGGYEVRVVPILERELQEGPRSMREMLGRIGAHRVASSKLGPEAELSRAFANVNTREEAVRAEAWLRGQNTSNPPSLTFKRTLAGRD